MCVVQLDCVDFEVCGMLCGIGEGSLDCVYLCVVECCWSVFVGFE